MSRQRVSKLSCGVCSALKPSIQSLGVFLVGLFLWQATAASAGTLSRVPITMGQFAVSPAGAATYSIPIQFANGILPGGGGLTPHLSLDYSSENGDGYWGYGWQLSGLSLIQGCGDDDKQLCLDGQQLIATSGAYGASGTVYHTQLETYAKIVSYGGSGSTPAYFKVWTKSGRVMELGNTADSHQVSSIWGVNKVSDVKGNYYTVTYATDSANTYPSLMVSQINYGGNTNTGLAPNKTITVSNYFSCPTCTSASGIYIQAPGGGTTPYVIGLSGNPLNGPHPRAHVTVVLIPGPVTQGRVDFTYQSSTTSGGPYLDWMASATQLSGATTTISFNQVPNTTNYAVTQVSRSNGNGGTATTTYAYSGYFNNAALPTSHGWAQVAATDPLGIVTTTNYYTDAQRGGLVQSLTQALNGVTLKSITSTYTATQVGVGKIWADSAWHLCLDSNNTCATGLGYITSKIGQWNYWAFNGDTEYYSVQLSQTLETGHDANIAALPSTTTTYTYDSFGNVTQSAASVSDGSSKTVNNTYTNDSTNWILGQLTDETVQSTVGSSSLTKHATYTHDAATGFVSQNIIESGDAAHQLTTSYTYDAFGNTVSTTVTDAYGHSRTATATYDSIGVYKTQACIGTECTAYSGLGTQTYQVTDPNGLTTIAQLDYYFQPLTVTRPDGTQLLTLSGNYGMNGPSSPAICDSTTAYNGPACPAGTAYSVMTVPRLASAGNFSATQAPTGQNGPMQVAYYDMLGRVIATDKQGLGGAWIRQSQKYDQHGNVSQVSRPYLISGGTPQWTTFAYDTLGRVATATAPDGGVTSYSYNGLTTSVTNAKGQTTTTVKNAQGLVASVTDALGHATSYAYDAFGNLTGVTDPLGNSISSTYDVRGNMTASTDPDMGTWSYVYDAFGQLVSLTDAKGQATTLSYDFAGRI